MNSLWDVLGEDPRAVNNQGVEAGWLKMQGDLIISCNESLGSYVPCWLLPPAAILIQYPFTVVSGVCVAPGLAGQV